MNKRPLWALLVVALVVVAGVLFLLPDSGSNPTSAGAPPEGEARLIPNSGIIQEQDNSGVTNPPESQPEFEIEKLQPGQKPPQFVVVSFDGGVESKSGIMQHYLDTAKDVDGRFSFFLSGVYLLPDNKMKLNYDPPGKPRGTSAIGFGDPGIISTRIDKLSEAWDAGHEIGTHYNGHFCGPGGVSAWNSTQWSDEIAEFNRMIDNWRTYNPQAADAGPLPFDSSVVKGGRTPCLEGQRPAMYKAFKKAGYLYDTSSTGALVWPKQTTNGLWNIPLQAIKVGSFKTPIISMDYNFLVNQTGGATTGSEAKCKAVEDESYNAYMKATRDLHNGNRAPLILGNHMNEWMCGAYKNALTRYIHDIHEELPDVRFISTLDLVHWMNAQDPAVLQELQSRPIQRQ